MPIFQIRRDVPGISRAEVDAAGFRAIICALEFEGLRWVYSTFDEETGVLTCVYEAESEAQIREHSRRSRIPCDDVRPVALLDPQEYVEQRAGERQPTVAGA